MEIGNESKLWKEDKNMLIFRMYDLLHVFLKLWCNGICLTEITFIWAEKWECKCISLIKKSADFDTCYRMPVAKCSNCVISSRLLLILS